MKLSDRSLILTLHTKRQVAEAVRRDKIIFQISDTLVPVKFHSTVVVPNQGLLSYGGFGNSYPSAQRLAAVGGSWTQGPPLYVNLPVEGHCIVQASCSLI